MMIKRVSIYKCIEEEIKRIDKYNISRIVLSYNPHYKKEILAFIKNPDNYMPIYLTLYSLSHKEFFNDFKYKNKFFNLGIEEINKEIYAILKLTFVKCIYHFGKIVDNRFYITDKKTYSYVDYNEEKLSINEITNLLKQPESYYRGHSNFEWTISPSIIRKLNENVVINEHYIVDVLYKQSNLLDKYQKYMNKPNNLYRLYSFIQHSTAYSPLIDLTSDPIISISFSLSNSSNINEYMQCKSAIFKIEKNKITDKINTIKDEKEISKFLKEHSFYSSKEKGFSFGHNEEFIEYLSGSKKIKKIIKFNTFQEIIQHLIPKYVIFDCPLNDRMRYQKGSFIYFYGEELVIFNNDLMYELSSDLKITKYCIPCKRKRMISDYIRKKHFGYDIEHLLNPYKIFGE